MKKFLLVYFVFYYFFLFLYAYFMNIGDVEIEYLSHNYPINFVENFFLNFGHNNFILRLPSLLLSIISVFLYYKISQKYLKRDGDILLSTVIFSLIPGFLIASLLFNKSIYLIFLLIFFIYTFLYHRFIAYFLLAIYAVLNYSFIFLYIALIFYSIYKKDTKFLIYSVLLLAINANYFNYDIKGHPSGHFIDILIIYFSIFSPFVFVYFLYSLVKFSKNPTLLWFISISGLLFSFLLSFRQRIKIDDFAPFVIIAVVFMIFVFISDYRIRLNVFRPFYRKLFGFLFFTLIFFDIVLFVTPYVLDKKIVSQFRYSYQIYNYLKAKKINYIVSNDTLLAKKLYFYGLEKGNKYFIFFDKKAKKVSISHNNQVLYNFYVSKLNK